MKKWIFPAVLGFTLAMAYACSDFANQTDEDFGATARKGQNSRTGTPLPPELLKPNEGAFSREKMTYNIGLLLTRQTRDFYLSVIDFGRQLEDGCETDTGLAAARGKLQKALLAYQTLQAAPVGPLQDDDQALLNDLYSWPVTNECAIDREVVKLALTGETSPKILFTAKGLSALEYLLFEPTLISGCNSRVFPDTKAWSEKPAAERRADRCAFARRLTSELETSASALWEAWNPARGHFAKVFVDGSRYDNLQQALNFLSDSFFALENVKDRKLGRPLGLHPDCEDEKCPDEAELRYADLGLAAIHRNLSSLEAIFLGDPRPGQTGFGFDDYLKERGRPDVSDRLTRALRQAVETSTALKDLSYSELLAQLDTTACAATDRENRTVPACALFQDLRYISMLLRSEFLSTLDLTPPKAIEGDNDAG